MVEVHVGLLYKDNLQIKQELSHSFPSFECLDISLTNLTKVRIFVIYRPPPSQVNGLTVSAFFEEFSDFLEQVVIFSEEILLLGDFHFHVNDVNDPLARRFLGLLDSFDLKQHVLCFTFSSGHTLDLMISRSDDSLLSEIHTSDIIISDHRPVLCHLNLVKPLNKAKVISFRCLKSICLESFRCEISSAFANVDKSDLPKLVSHYYDVLSSAIDSHAPLKRKAITVRTKKAPWYTHEIDSQKKLRRRYERRWRATGLASDKLLFSRQCAIVNKMLFSSKQQYFSSVITDNGNDQRTLFKIVSGLLQPNHSLQYPSSSDDTSLANSFIQFFSNKIESIKQDISKSLPVQLRLPPELFYLSKFRRSWLR